MQQEKWQELVSGFSEKQTVKGIVRNKNRDGVFVELKPGLFGMAEHKSGILQGDRVRVLIKKISPEKMKIKLVILD